MVDTIILGRGKRKAISISKIKKTTASKKNRNENGVRAEFLGSNPHSYGESLSRSEVNTADIYVPSNNKRKEIRAGKSSISNVRGIYIRGKTQSLV